MTTRWQGEAVRAHRVNSFSIVLHVVVMPFVTSTVFSQIPTPGKVDPTFQPGAIINGSVYTSALQPDGKVVVGGWFTVAKGSAGSCLARINADGSRDKSFDIGSGANDPVLTLVIQTDGRIVVGGKFTSMNSMARGRIARLEPNGTLDLSFDPGSGADGPVFACALQPDGKLIIAGDFTSIGDTGRKRLARLNVDGSLDLSFDPGSGADRSIRSVAVQPDGKILVGGDFTLFGDATRSRIARSNSDGTVDAGFAPVSVADFLVRTIGLQSDGRILVGGDFYTVEGRGIARLNADGSLDATFRPGSSVFGPVYAMSLLPNNRVLIGGSFTGVNGVSRYLARLNLDGRRDSTFNPAPDLPVYCVSAHGDGRAIVGGDFKFMGDSARGQIARLQPDGSADLSFNSGCEINSFLGSPERYVNAVAAQPDGKVLIGGTFVWVNGLPQRLLARLNGDGSLDPAFNSDILPADSEVKVMALQPDGKVIMIIGGTFNKVNNVVRDKIARLNPDGRVDTTFSPGKGIGGFVHAVAVQSDEKLLVGGRIFSFYDNVQFSSARLVIRLNLDGTADTGFAAVTGTNFYARTIATQPDGKILIGGDFTDVSGVTQRGIARLNSNGSVDTGFDCGAGVSAPDFPVVYALAPQADGKVVIGGYFTKVDGTDRYHIARLNADGGVDAAFVPVDWAAKPIRALTVEEDGRVIVGEGYYQPSLGERGRVTRLNTDGTVDASFDSGSGADGYVFSLAIQSDRKILVGGMFDGINGVPCGSVARLFGGTPGAFTLVAPERLQDAAFRFSLSDVVNGRYEIQASSDLTNWIALDAVNVATNTVAYTETNTIGRYRFYKAVRLQ